MASAQKYKDELLATKIFLSALSVTKLPNKPCDVIVTLPSCVKTDTRPTFFPVCFVVHANITNFFSALGILIVI